MTKMMIEKLTTKSSKQDEIALLRKMKEAAGTGTYLAQFLTDAMVNWLEQRIADDWATDLLGDYEHEKQVHEKNATELVRLRHELEVSKQCTEDQRRQVLAHKERAEALEGRLRDVTESAANFQQQVKAMTGEVQDLHGRETMHIEALKMHTDEKKALLAMITRVVFDEDDADIARIALRMIVTGRSP